LLFPNSYTILFWEFYFLPFSVRVQTNVIYVTLLSLLLWVVLILLNISSSHSDVAESRYSSYTTCPMKMMSQQSLEISGTNSHSQHHIPEHSNLQAYSTLIFTKNVVWVLRAYGVKKTLDAYIDDILFVVRP